MAVMVVTEGNLWVNLVAIGKKEKNFLLDAPLSQTGLFGTSVEAVVEKFTGEGTVGCLQEINSSIVLCILSPAHPDHHSPLTPSEAGCIFICN